MVKLKTSTWHMTLAKMGDPYIDMTGRSDLCHYVRAAASGALQTGLLFTLFTGVMWCVLSFLLWAYVGFRFGWFEVPIPAMIAMAIFAVVAVIGACVGIGYFATESETASPIRAAYRGWKEKHCPLVEFESGT